jgi:HPt (histidine-containing phosphotransfer) domain-containing protein/PAS domain-containing protein
MSARRKVTIIGFLAILALTALWNKTRSVSPEAHREYNSALLELRSIDRTINQDVLRARFQLVDSYHPVLTSYRRLEVLEARIADVPEYLDHNTRSALRSAIDRYRTAVTNKQRFIETFKYQAADLKELLAHLPAAGSGAAKAAIAHNDPKTAQALNGLLQQTLLYNLTSDQTYAPEIKQGIENLTLTIESSQSHAIRQRVRSFTRTIQRLLSAKPVVDRQLAAIFAEPIVSHEDEVAALYFEGHAAAEAIANRYRMAMYATCVVLLGLIAYGFLRLDLAARALATANEHLEERVQERTRELNHRNGELKAVLDNVEQALLVVDMAGNIARERSAAVDRWFPSATPGRSIWGLVHEFDHNAAYWLELGWEDLQSGAMPSSIVISQLPKTWCSGERHYHVSFQPIGGEANFDRMLLIVSDVTDQIARTHREADQREQLFIFERFMADRSGLFEFLSESKRLVDESINTGTSDQTRIFRLVHTLKGNCALFGIGSIARRCHELESKMVESDEPVALQELEALGQAWASFEDKVRGVVGQSHDDHVEFSKEELRAFRREIAARRDPTELLSMLRQLQREPVSHRFARIAQQASTLARNMGKGDVDVEINGHDVRLDSRRWAPFWSNFVHLLRNSLDHGIEAPEERARTGKPIRGRLKLTATLSANEVTIEFSDDGRGIDWNGVREKATKLGIEVPSEAELSELLLKGGVSTKEEVTDYSGRGAGVSACFEACAELGGRTELSTQLGLGTTFRFIVPSDDAVQKVSIIPAA